MEHSQRVDPANRRLTVLYGFLAVAILYLARPVLIPVGLAVLLTFIVAPLVIRVERRIHSRAMAISLVTVLVLSILGAGALVVGQQVIGLAEDLPSYRDTIVRKIRAVQAGPGGVVGRMTQAIRRIGDDIAKSPREPQGVASAVPPGDEARPAGTSANGAPDPSVQVVAAQTDEGGSAALTSGILMSLLPSVTVGAIAILLMVMMLVSRESIRDRIVRLAGLHQIGLTTQTLEEAGARVGSYLRAQLLINSLYAAAITAGLLALGLPSAALCGVLAGVLRFVPMIGPWLGAAIPAALALAVFDDWHHLGMVLALFAVLELLNNLVLEPWLFSSSTGLSGFGVVLAIIFWTWVWGAVGTVLALPMTVCLVVFARQIPQLGALSILLGDEPALSEPMRLYHRLLCRDELEAGALLTASAGEDRDAVDVLDGIVLPSLSAARTDLTRGLITPVQAARVGALARDIAIEWLNDRDSPAVRDAAEGARVACLPALDELDEAAAGLLAHLLQREGVDARVIPAALLFGERISAAGEEGIGLIVVSSVEPSNGSQTRRIEGALRRRIPNRPVLLAAWSAQPAAIEQAAPAADGNTHPSAHTFREAISVAKIRGTGDRHRNSVPSRDAAT